MSRRFEGKQTGRLVVPLRGQVDTNHQAGLTEYAVK